MTKKDIHYLQQLIEKEENQTLSDAERRLLDDFLKHEYEAAEWDTAKMGFKASISADIYKRIKKQTHLKKSFHRYYKYAAAAVITLLIASSILLRPQEVKEITIATSAATDSVKLKDGTTVYLASNSSFKYPEHFDGKIRKVTLLKGNAFFKVAKDHVHPFIISSSDITTKVLGTSFHISLDKGISSVTVITGHVKVSSKQQVAFLNPNENAVFTASSGLRKQKVEDVSLYSWYKKDLTLNDVTLDKVFKLLDFKYGKSFITEDKKILDTRITLYIRTDLPLQNIIDQINYITHLKFTQHGDKIAVNE